MAEMLLRQFKWDRNRLAEEYMSDPEAVAAKAGVPSPEAPDLSIIHQREPVYCLPATSDEQLNPPAPPFSGTILVSGRERPAKTLPPLKCSICYEESVMYSALACGHPFCNECYAEFVAHKIADEGHDCFFARCPEPKCKIVISKALVQSLMPPGEALTRYEKAASLARSFVDDQPLLKWCPAPDCCQAVSARAGALSVQCSCKHRFCFACGLEDHQPASCKDLQRWMVKCRDDSETFNWLVANTKACPKCGTSIEKNGGCNHMTCKSPSCKHEFCWVCSGPWKDHAGSYYNCNKYDPEKEKDSADGKKKDSSRQALERYLHYYTRFVNHSKSLEFELDAKTKMEAKIKEMEQLGDNTWMDCLYLNEANEALHECRYTLKFTYVFAFYLPEEANFKLHFEMQQTQLEQQTEELAELLERDVSDINRMDVVHCFQMAKKRLRNLMEITEEEVKREAEAGGGAAGSSSTPMVA
jgi:ariadne-1